MTDASFYGSAYTQAESNGQHVSGITVPQKSSIQADLSTKAAQHKHHAAIHARLMTPKPKRTPSVIHDEVALIEVLSIDEPEVIPVLEPEAEISGPLTVRRIQRVVARHFGISRMDIMSKSRSANIVWARHVAMYLCRKLILRRLHPSDEKARSLSYPETGRRFGVDHTSVLFAEHKIERLRHDNPQLASDLAAIEARLNELA